MECRRDVGDARKFSILVHGFALIVVCLGEAGLHHERSDKDGVTDSGYNIVEFEEDTKSRRFRAKVSDRAIDSISAPLSFILERRMGVEIKRGRQRLMDSDVIVDDKQLTLPGLDTEAIAEKEQGELNAAESNERKSFSADSEANQLKEIFRSTKPDCKRLVHCVTPCA